MIMSLPEESGVGTTGWSAPASWARCERTRTNGWEVAAGNRVNSMSTTGLRRSYGVPGNVVLKYTQPPGGTVPE